MTNRASPFQCWISAIALGMIGFILNGIPIAISPGVDIVLGSAFVMTGLRLISKAQFAVAFSISSSKTIWLWGHQWAWLIWTLEGAFLAWRRNQRSPVYVDLSFWLFIGSVLVWLTYAYVLAVDRETVHLTVLKQAINGVLNVALGEILYIALSYVLRASANVTLPSVSVGSIIFPSMIVLPVLPALLLMRIQAPTWEQLVARSAEMQLSEDLDRVKHRLIEWRDRETVLLMKSAEKDINKGLGIIGSVRTDLENEGAVTRRAMSLAYPVGHPLLLATGVSNRRFVFAAPNVDGGAIFASISQANLDAALKGSKSDADGSFIILVDAQNRIAASSSSILPDPQIVQSLLSAPVGRLTKIVPAPAFGISQMNNEVVPVFWTGC